MYEGLDYIFGEELSDGNITRSDLEALVMIQSSEYRRASSFCGAPVTDKPQQPSGNTYKPSSYQVEQLHHCPFVRYIPKSIHSDTYILAYIHTYIHTYIHKPS